MTKDKLFRVENVLVTKDKLFRVENMSVTKDKLFRVENVLEQRKRGRNIQILVKWVGHPESFISWLDNISLGEYKG